MNNNQLPLITTMKLTPLKRIEREPSKWDNFYLISEPAKLYKHIPSNMHLVEMYKPMPVIESNQWDNLLEFFTFGLYKNPVKEDRKRYEREYAEYIRRLNEEMNRESREILKAMREGYIVV